MELQAGIVYNDFRGRTMKRLIAVTCLFLASVPVCSAQEKLRIVTTTSDLRSLAKAVGAEQVIVSSLLPSGESPEEYQPKLQDVDQLKGAKIVIRAAPGVDPWFDKLLARGAVKHEPPRAFRAASPAISTRRRRSRNDPLTISAGFQRSRRASRGGPNPHYWLDPEKRRRHHRENGRGILEGRSEEREILRGQPQEFPGAARRQDHRMAVAARAVSQRADDRLP